jgi:hypothetical protein
MLGTLLRCSVAAVASIALFVAFVSTPEGFTKPKKPTRSGRRMPQRSHRAGGRSHGDGHANRPRPKS